MPHDPSPVAPPDDADPMVRLRHVMAALRDPDHGCPWDLAQDFASIAPYTIEEAYEVADAIARSDWAELQAELGDLLLQVVYHAQIAQEHGHFDLADVADGIARKMIARHPHVFGGADRDKSPEQQSRDWEALKAEERRRKSRSGVLADVALALPALTRAEKLQKRAARVGFDWPEIGPVVGKICEEAGELVEAHASASAEEVRDEFGDLLFAMVNLGRHMGVDAEAALRAANEKFTRRFSAIEAGLAQQGRSMDAASLEEMEALWQAAKAKERR